MEKIVLKSGSEEKKDRNFKNLHRESWAKMARYITVWLIYNKQSLQESDHFWFGSYRKTGLASDPSAEGAYRIHIKIYSYLLCQIHDSPH
jgi:hypothetical protein